MTVALRKVSMGVVEPNPSHVFDGRAVSVFTEHVLQGARRTWTAPAISASEISRCALSSMVAIARLKSTGVLSCRSSMVGSNTAVLGKVANTVATR